MDLANRIEAAAIVALTESGATAQWLSRYRSAVPIYALSHNASARRRMRLLRDVQPVAFVGESSGGDPAQLVLEAIGHLVRMGLLEPGWRVLLTHGDQVGRHGGTNTLKLLSVDEAGAPQNLREL